MRIILIDGAGRVVTKGHTTAPTERAAVSDKGRRRVFRIERWSRIDAEYVDDEDGTLIYREETQR